MSNVLAFEPKRTCVFLADKKRHITDRFFSVKASQNDNSSGFYPLQAVAKNLN